MSVIANTLVVAALYVYFWTRIDVTDHFLEKTTEPLPWLSERKCRCILPDTERFKLLTEFHKEKQTILSGGHSRESN